MSKLISVTDMIYHDLKRLKEAKHASFSDILRELLTPAVQKQKDETLMELVECINKLEAELKHRKKENVSAAIDSILYGR